MQAPHFPHCPFENQPLTAKERLMCIQSPDHLTCPSVWSLIAVSLLSCGLTFAQQSAKQPPASPGTLPGATNPPEPEQKRIFGIIPNYRTFPSFVQYKPLTPGQKFKIASQDSFDRGTFVLAAVFAAEGQLSRSNPAFGNGVAAYGRYLATAYADFAIGDFMTEAIYPVLLHQDPRYFRRGTGNLSSRLRYAIGQIVWTHSDSGGKQFNYSEIMGNATAVAISNAYYSDNRDAASASIKLATQLGVD